VAGTELMPRLVVGDTEIVCGKLKNCIRFLKPTLEPLPKPRQAQKFLTSHAAVSNLLNLVAPDTPLSTEEVLGRTELFFMIG
jgi:hypothetical protein